MGINIFRHVPDVSKIRVVLSGIQPSGTPHIGNLLGALRPWNSLVQRLPATSTALFEVADLHALDIHHASRDMRLRRRKTLAAILATGLDPERCIMFYQSSVLTPTF